MQPQAATQMLVGRARERRFHGLGKAGEEKAVTGLNCTIVRDGLRHPF